MEEQKRLDIEFFNKVMRRLSEYFQLQYIPPLYSDEYIQFELIRKSFSRNQKPTIITIKSNKRITFTVDCKPNIPKISATQTKYSASEKYKGWTRISCGEKSIDTFLEEMDSDIPKYL